MSFPLSIYLHIPFCTTKCTYCAFNTYTNLNHLVDQFVDALIREIEIISKTNPYTEVKTIYFGGGSPSLLSPGQFERILATIAQNFVVHQLAEISIESNPNDLTFDYLAALRILGINRLSIGMQSANLDELNLFARHHDNTVVVNAMATARKAGFENINLDLIYGFPKQTLSSWEFSLNQLLILNPEHISLYALGLEEGTALFSWVKKGSVALPDDDLAADMYELATDRLGAAGYQQYEISNWSRVGYECEHNIQYWRNIPYIGLGPGAHGFAGGVRYATVLSPNKYIKLIHNASTDTDLEFPYTPAVDTAVKVSTGDEISETLMMSLRLTQEGVIREQFMQRFGIDLLDLHGTTLERFVQLGLLEITTDVVRITQKGRLLSNMIFRELV